MNNLRRRVIGNNKIGRSKIDGYEVVDLGLPSGKLWATCDIGSEKETDIGDYYMFGALSPVYYKTSSGNYLKATQTEACLPCFLNSPTLPDDLNVVKVQYGQKWNMCNYTIVNELKDNCTFEKILLEGRYYIKANSKNNGAYILFPCANFYMYEFDADSYLESFPGPVPDSRGRVYVYDTDTYMSWSYTVDTYGPHYTIDNLYYRGLVCFVISDNSLYVNYFAGRVRYFYAGLTIRPIYTP